MRGGKSGGGMMGSLNTLLRVADFIFYVVMFIVGAGLIVFGVNGPRAAIGLGIVLVVLATYGVRENVRKP
jgi:hypothetical protein